MTIDDWNDGIRSEIPQMLKAGIPTFKMYMTYPAMMIGDRDLFWPWRSWGNTARLPASHCENAASSTP